MNIYDITIGHMLFALIVGLIILGLVIKFPVLLIVAGGLALVAVSIRAANRSVNALRIVQWLGEKWGRLRNGN